MITQQIAEQASKVFGNTSLVSGTMTAGATVAKSQGMMEWMNENALGVGGICTICTLILYFVFGIINIRIQARKKK